MMDFEKLLKTAKEQIDFNSTASMMKKDKWIWGGINRSPTAKELELLVDRLAFDALDGVLSSGGKEYTMSTGGFTVTVYRKRKKDLLGLYIAFEYTSTLGVVWSDEV